ncbi:proton-conducting transporter transmembrane domain-containing protein, partial [Mycobacterium avium]
MTATLTAAPIEAPNTLRRNVIASRLAGLTSSGLGIGGAVCGIAAVFGVRQTVHVGWLLPLSGLQLDLDPVGGFFMALIGGVAVPVGFYSIGYARREHLGRVSLAMLPLFVAAMMLVPAAGSVTTFLLAWELMATASLVLVLAQHTRPEVRSAGLFYAVMTQLGFVAILIGLMVLSAAGGADRFADLTRVSDGARTVVFVLTMAGFGSKAGLVPLHAWLPRAHPEAPSPVSALMSAAMVNLGVYGIVRFDLQLLGPGPRWWAITLLVVGGVSAVYGVLQASVATDLKRLLAYSTTENMGLITLALGAATLLADSGAHSAATIAMAAALLHLIGHAAFKSLGFLAAGSVLAATGLRDLDLLGGLARRMPATTALFGVAALGASGLPLGAGFVSEWLLVQSLIHAAPQHNTVVALAAPLAVGAVALTTGLGVAAMVKAFGIGFLARPRSQPAADAREVPAVMVAGMALAATGCVVVAVAPLVVGSMLGRVLTELPASRAVAFTDFGAVLRLPGLHGSIAPGAIAAALAAAVLAAVGLACWRSRRRSDPVTLPLWACGAD